LKKLRWQIIVVLLALAAIAVLLLSQQPISSLSVDGEDQPLAGGVYTEALIGSIGRLNPLLDYYNSADYDIDRLIYSGLVRFDSRGLPYGDLAETWGISRDGKTYSFSIRADAYWHDGQPVTAEDVVFTVEQMRDDRLPLPDDVHAFWDQVEVEALDEKTLQFRLPEAFSPFLDYLSFGVLPRHALEGLSGSALIDAPFNLSPIGSGPYRIESVDTEGDGVIGVTLRAFPEYYAGPLYLEKIIFRYYPDEAAAMSAYEAGEVMGVSQLTGGNLERALRLPNLKVFTGRLPRLTMIYLNLDDPRLPFFQDARVRRALLQGVNRRWILDRLMGGQAIPAHGPIFPDSWAYYEGIEQIEFDTAAATAQLKDAGYTVPAEGSNVREKDGVKLAFELAYPEGELFGQIAEQIRQDWSRLGVEVELVAMPYDELIADHLEPRTYDAALVDINFSRSPDPDPYPFWHQAQITNGQNYAQWDDRQVSEYLEQARVNDDFSERAKRYRNFQVRFAQELPALALFYPTYSYGVDSQIRGASMGPLYDPSDRFNAIAQWHTRTESVAQTGQTPTVVAP
jgi:peptide/nickel transport system substrate-binding protein